MPNEKTLILASQSWQRKKILEKLGLKFKVLPAHIDEHHSGLKKPHAIVKSIAKRKADAVSQKHPKSLVIAADTIVILSNGKLSLKPKNIMEAKQIIKTYQGKHCDVYTGLAIKHPEKKTPDLIYEKSSIHFKSFSDEAIDKYLKGTSWKGSSGALTLEEVGEWVKHVKGDYSNILGLPIHSLKFLLKKS